MRHRKKLLLATVLLAAAYAALCFWPHSNPEAVRALGAMRTMIDIDDSAEPPMAEGVAGDNMKIELCVMIVSIDMTDATAGLLSGPGCNNDKTIVGRLKSVDPFLETALSTGVVQIQREPVIETLCGQQQGIATGAEVEIVPASPGGAAAPVLIQDPNAGTNWTYAARLTAAGTIDLQVEFKQTRTGRKRTIVTDDGPKEVAEVHAVAAKGRLDLKIGETLLIGGLSQRQPNRIMHKLPGIGDLAGIGSWFQFTRRREIEEELVILVTPRIITPVAAKLTRPD